MLARRFAFGERVIEKLGRAAASMSDWAAKSEKNKIGFDPVNVPDRPKNARSYISSKTKKMQAKVKQMEKLIETYDFTMLFVEHDSRFCEKIDTKIVDM